MQAPSAWRAGGVGVAEDAFKKAGKTVHIDHDANVANIININKEEAKCGVILRGPNHTTTFNFSAKVKRDWKITPSQCLNVSAAFLEGLQLSFFVGMTDIKLHYDLIDEFCDEAKKAEDARSKISRLTNAILQYENMADITYRPQKPAFPDMVAEAEKFAKKIFAEEVKQKIASGEQEGWID